jgi:hypothetical protein
MTMITGESRRSAAGLPVIQNLRREIAGGATIIKWNIAAEVSPEACDFGLWFGSSTPVDRPARPDQIVPTTWPGRIPGAPSPDLATSRAVAAFTSTMRGMVAGRSAVGHHITATRRISLRFLIYLVPCCCPPSELAHRIDINCKQL